MLSLFPQPAPALPNLSTLLIAGPYHPSAPIHLALTLNSENSKARTIILSPSRSVFKEDLLRFNDSWLNSHSGDGKISELTSNIVLFYPPTPVHLSLVLSMLHVPSPDSDGNEPTWSDPRTMQISAPSLVVLLEPSRYFLSSTGSPMSSSARTLPSYLSLVNRVFVSISNLTSDSPPKFALFDSQLHNFKLPVVYEPSRLFGEEMSSHQPPQMPVLPVVEKLFQWVGIFEDDPSYIPSSQGDEVAADEGARKQLRLYPGSQDGDNDVQLYHWTEIRRRASSRESEETYFRWN
ncbi:hypothetical protein BDZ97DRAFT_1775307 [Flammula alnicola]|nr:hypothetical protein BDZ97DRAFT_1775307 [Flammula alnicola]